VEPGSALTLLPGFIDCHVHLVFSGVDPQRMLHEPFSYQFYAAARNMAATLATGVTTVRDAAAPTRDEAGAGTGLIAGPRLLTAVTLLGQTGGHTTAGAPAAARSRCCSPTPAGPR